MGEARLKGGQPSPTGEGAKSPPLWFDWLTIKEGRNKEGSVGQQQSLRGVPSSTLSSTLRSGLEEKGSDPEGSLSRDDVAIPMHIKGVSK